MNYPKFKFKVLATIENTKARAGILSTPHGDVLTPSFIFCATKGAIRCSNMDEMRVSKTQFILGNTYHLALQPGAEVIAKMGGLGKFMGWRGPTLTDSGGFQIFSLGHGSVSSEIKSNKNKCEPEKRLLQKITEQGAHIKSYVTGDNILLTPEKSIQIQNKIGADIILVLDECTPFHVSKQYTEKSMLMSNRWALRSFEEFKRLKQGSAGPQALYGISQGGIYPDLRRRSAEFLNETDFFGHAVGGSLGQDKNQMIDVVKMATEHLREDRPIHLLGIGAVEDVWRAVELGIDSFDCVSPTRIARHGWAMVNSRTAKFKMNLKNAKHINDERTIDEHCGCATCKGGYSRGYLNHLIKGRELLVMNLLTVHNVYFMNNMMQTIRKSIIDGDYFEIRKNWIGQ